MDDIILHIIPMLETLLAHPAMESTMLKWAHGIAKKTYTSEVALLSSQKHGLHYMTRGMTEEKLKSFDTKGISILMSTIASCTWELLGELLVADMGLSTQCVKLREQAEKSETKRGNKGQGTDKDMQQDSHPEMAEEWTWQFLDQSIPLVTDGENEPEDIFDQVAQCKASLNMIVSRSTSN